MKRSLLFLEKVIILNKTDLMTGEERARIRRLLAEMNASATVVEASYGKIPSAAVLATGAFQLTEAQKHEMWLKEARVGEHKPESEEYGVGSFVFKARRPFHPRRLWDALRDVEAKRPPFERIVRAKGIAWLATRHRQAGVVSFAGRQATLLPGPPWWESIPRADWPEGLEEELKPLWDAAHGDRQQVSMIENVSHV